MQDYVVLTKGWLNKHTAIREAWLGAVPAILIRP